MLEAPIGEGANTFIWIFCILVGFVKALMVLDVFYGNKKKTEH
ncbi:hypothetical protein FUAX_27670 [Fulvitalea axinellae]|uniref:Uncharacterized protein n=1 Tax=Fulvitalea axinellae TaxID=1182444 RepID=A0AAU9DD29_9BACT|nr:hypothetical protein FUAX_27670 [Fulvitalea axinellae]